MEVRDLTQMLQWGRNLIVAEGQLAPLVREEQGVLQWGRNLIVAEGTRRGVSGQRGRSFNGAAT